MSDSTSKLCIDLGCGAGGASMGLKRAGFDVMGIDIDAQPEYPFRFWQTDVTTVSSLYFKDAALVWASMPCQAYSWSAKRWHKHYPRLIEPIREKLKRSGIPFVLENVLGAPIRHDLMLCGSMFDLKVIKHRFFEIEGFTVPQLLHPQHSKIIKNLGYVTTAGHGGNGSAKLRDWQNALGIDWINNKHNLAQAIPPAYSEYIGKAILET